MPIRYPRYGYRRIQVLLEREGHAMSADCTHRLRQKAGLQVPEKRPRRRVAGSRPRPPSGPDQEDGGNTSGGSSGGSGNSGGGSDGADNGGNSWGGSGGGGNSNSSMCHGPGCMEHEYLGTAQENGLLYRLVSDVRGKPHLCTDIGCNVMCRDLSSRQRQRCIQAILGRVHDSRWPTGKPEVNS